MHTNKLFHINELLLSVTVYRCSTVRRVIRDK